MASLVATLVAIVLLQHEPTCLASTTAAATAAHHPRYRLRRELAAAVPAALFAKLHHRQAQRLVTDMHISGEEGDAGGAAGLANQSGRRPSPAHFGGDPTGRADSTADVLAALDVCLAAADKTANGQFSVGSKDAGGCVLDLDGGEWLMSKPLRIRTYISNMQVADGSLVADPHSASWRDATGYHNGGQLHEHLGHHPAPRRYLIEIGETPTTKPCVDHGPLKEGSCNEAIGLRGLFLDGSHGSNGILVNKVMGTTIGQSYLLNFTDFGIMVNKGHEVMIEEVWLGETNFDFKFSAARPPRATAIQINGNDDYIQNSIVFSAEIGLQNNGAANYVSGLHVWMPWNGAGSFPDCCQAEYCAVSVAIDDRGVPVPGKVTQNRYEGCYVDCSVAQFVNPSLVEWSDGYVLGGLGILVDADHGTVDRLTITTTEFMGGGISLRQPNTNRSAAVLVTDTFIDGNLFYPVAGGFGPNRTNTSTARSSRASRTMTSVAPMQRWLFDFCSDLLFPNITAVRHSFTAATGFPVAVARPPEDGGCVVAVELNHASAGTMIVDVDTSRWRPGGGGGGQGGSAHLAGLLKSDDLQKLSSHAKATPDTRPWRSIVPNNLAVQTMFYETSAPPSAQMLQSLADSGVKYIRHDIVWVTVEQEESIYNWRYHDELVAAVDAVGIRLFSTVSNEENGGRTLMENCTGSCGGVRQQNYGLAGCNGGCNSYTAESSAAYGRFVAAAVKRYKGRGFIWELDDEPLMFWKLPSHYSTLAPTNKSVGGYPPDYWIACTGGNSPPGCGGTYPASDPVCGDGFNTSICSFLYDQYVDIALVAYKAMREAGPEEYIIGPSESQLGTSSDTQNFFLRRCAERGLLKYWDAIAVHLYRMASRDGSDGPESALADISRNLAIAAEYPGGEGLGLVSGEWGYVSDGGNVGKGEACCWDEMGQAVMLARLYLTGFVGNVSLTSWFTWSDCAFGDPIGGVPSFGLVVSANCSCVMTPETQAKCDVDAKACECEVIPANASFREKQAHSALRTLSQTFDGFAFGERLHLPSLGAKDFVVQMESPGFNPRYAVWKQANYNDTAIQVEIWHPATTGCFHVISAVGCKMRDACTASDGSLQLNLSAVPQYLVPKSQFVPSLLWLPRCANVPSPPARAPKLWSAPPPGVPGINLFRQAPKPSSGVGGKRSDASAQAAMPLESEGVADFFGALLMAVPRRSSPLPAVDKAPIRPTLLAFVEARKFTDGTKAISVVDIMPAVI
jgi:hypothetical protein